MPDQRTPIGEWVRGLLRSGNADAPAQPGRATSVDARHPVEATEALLCDALCHVGGRSETDVNVFGRRVERVPSHDGPGALAIAAGLTMSGRRAAAFLQAGDLSAACPAIRAAVRRCLPLVAHARVGADEDHAGCHAVADAGAFVVFAADAQEASDLTLVARRVAERALIPGVVVLDGAPTEAEWLAPEPEVVRSLVGSPAEPIDAPTPAQTLVFGDKRRALPRWFDPSRPVAHGVAPSGPGAVAGVAGRQEFFASHLPALVREALDELARLTGRRRDLVRRHRVEGSSRVVVALGTAVARAEEAAEQVRGSRGGKAGVLGITWLRPFPGDAVREALVGARTVTVLERSNGPLDAPPLLREIRAALGATRPALVTASHAGADGRQLETLFENMRAGDAMRPAVRLGAAPPSVGSPFPRREALLQRIRRDYPELDARAPDRPARGDAEAGQPVLPHPDSAPPLAVRRFSKLDTAYDNVARFWGEVAQPRAAGDGTASVPDPYLALEAVPACTSTFRQARNGPEELPRIDPEACTGCGRCWTRCPHSALAPAAMGTHALLEALARPDEGGEAAAKLQRVLRQLAQRVNRLLAGSEAQRLEGGVLDEAFEWLVQQMKLSDAERPAFESAFRPIAERVAGLPLSVTDPFFRDVETKTKGGGELLLLALDPRSCTGCGVCEAACADEALRMEPAGPESVAAARDVYRSWEMLPDTAGSTIARAAADDRVGPLAAILLSRHCSFTLPGGDPAEPGSGQRLAVRQLVAVTEFEMQRRWVEQVTLLEDLARRLRGKIHESMSGAVAVEDLDRLDGALREVPQRRVDVTRVLEQVREAGERTDIDASRLHLLAHTAVEIERLSHEVVEGPQGSGRARFGVVIAGDSLADWCARFPLNPFGAPVAVDLAGGGVDVALGLARGLLAERTEEVRRVRLAELLLEAPADLPARERALGSLSPEDLTRKERSLCPPLLVIATGESFAGSDVAAIAELLSSDLPIKLIVLDGRDLTSTRVDPTHLGLAQSRAFVLAAAVSHPDQLYRGMCDALEWAGAALVHVHAPSPARHGFDPRDTVSRAQAAVAARVHPLVRAQPGGGAPDLAGNPVPGKPWADESAGAARTPAEWALGESRYEAHFAPAGGPAGVPIEEWLFQSPDERGAGKPTVPGPNGGRLAVGDLLASAVADSTAGWMRLRDAAGLSGPAADLARERAERDLRATHDEDLASLRAEYEAKIEEIEKRQLSTQAARLRARLLRLAGLGGPGAERGRDPS